MPNNIRIKQLDAEELSGFFNSIISLDKFVSVTGNQIISGLKTFTTQPYFNEKQILVQGDSIQGVVAETGLKEDLNVYISLNGNDANAELGNIFRPYFNSQNAFSGLYFSNRTGCLVFGQGTFERINIPYVGANSWPERISIKGAGEKISYLKGIISSGNDIYLSSDRTINLGDISTNGISKSGVDSSATHAGKITLLNCKAKSLTGIGGSYLDATNAYLYQGMSGAIVDILNSEVDNIFISGGANSLGPTFIPDQGGTAGSININNSLINGNITCIGGFVKTGRAGNSANIKIYNSKILSILNQGGQEDSSDTRNLSSPGDIRIDNSYCINNIINSGGNSTTGIGGNGGKIIANLSTIESGLYANGGLGFYSNGSGGYINLNFINLNGDLFSNGGSSNKGGKIDLYSSKVNNVYNSGAGQFSEVNAFHSFVNSVNS